jgi:hypothetical protein
MRTVFVSLMVTSSLLLCSAAPALATEPWGWVGNEHVSAYTLQPWEFELSGSLQRVNDRLDVLNLREDLLAGSNRLSSDSGDFEGMRGELRIGVWQGLELFYQRHDHDMTLKLQDDRLDIIDADQALETNRSAFGAKWVFYESTLADRSRPWTSAALELTRTRSSSQNFGGFLEFIRFSPTTSARLDPPQRFDLNRLKDDGWKARVIYSHGLGQTNALSWWAGYGKIDSSSGTDTSFEQPFFRTAFLQTFDTRESLYYAGVSLNWQANARLPVQIGYEYLNIHQRNEQIISSNSALVPSFLRGSNLSVSADNNHTAYGRISWWVTPAFYTSLSGKVFKNQFVGVLPHFNNPLSARFSETAFGYLEWSMGLKFNVRSQAGF